MDSIDNMSYYQRKIIEIKELMTEISSEMDKILSVKIVGKRFRKNSVKLSKLFKELRKLTLNHE